MFEYTVSVDFGDRAAPTVRTFDDQFLLGGYLEQIPNKLGFELNGGADINIKVRPKPHHPRLI